MRDWCLYIHHRAVNYGLWNYPRPVSYLLSIVAEKANKACEADRCGDYEQFEKLIADIFILLFDMCGYMTIDIDEVIKERIQNK